MPSSKILVSIIVPAYNVSAYVKRCMDSLVGQTLRPIEIIAIDDCSTDNTLSILEEYTRYDFVRIIKLEKNTGLFGVRQVGIAHAKGEYIGFVDGDDFVDPTMYERLYSEAMEKKADIVMCSYYCFYTEGENIPGSTAIQDKEINEKIERFNKRTIPSIVLIGHNVWNKIWHSSLFKKVEEIGCFPPRSIYMGEDIALSYPLYYFSKKIAYTNLPLYFYRKRREISFRMKYLTEAKIIVDYLSVFFRRVEGEDNEPLFSQLNSICYYLFYYHLLGISHVAAMIDTPRKTMFREIKGLLRQRTYNPFPLKLWFTYYLYYVLRRDGMFYPILAPIWRAIKRWRKKISFK